MKHPGHKKKKVKIIGILLDGEPTFHIPNCSGSDYHSLCGIDADDPDIGHGGIIDIPKGQRINCPVCRMEWENLMKLKLKMSDFE